MNHFSFIGWILLLPLGAFVVLGLWGRKHLGRFSGIIATTLLLASTILSFVAAYQYFFVYGKVEDVYQSIIGFKYNWLSFSGHLSIDMGVLLDPISVMMLLVINFVSLMVHIFSLGYMKGEDRFATYYAFLSLFTFSMLGLVLSVNIFQLYIFWELVGISSYLLIGFYFDRPTAVAASKKAFIVTRFADLGLLIGILILAFHSDTLDLPTLVQRLSSTQSPQWLSLAGTSFLGVSMLGWGLILVFVGGAGKSAMFPLHIWLPDAMEGPTPVSALIHAATMVVAGVYLVARLFPVYSTSPNSLHLIAYVGAISALLAAACACAQTDIKRVLAFSTISQIGFMMLALGVSGYAAESGLGYTASMFHLFTHAFFKSLLFLGAGAIIHQVHSNELKDMGGLANIIPLTHICFLVGCLAIAGLPPFSGFFSKEEILLAAFRGDKFIFSFALFTSGLTSFYMFRLYFSIFFNKPTPSNLQVSNPKGHGAGNGRKNSFPLSMDYPLVVLALCATGVGFIPFSRWVTASRRPLDIHPDLSFSALPVSLALAGIALAAFLFFRANEKPAKITAYFGLLYRLTYRKFYFDELYLFITKKIIFNLIGRPAAWFDKNIVDGFMNLLARVTAKTSKLIRGLQSGKIQDYAWLFFAGVAGLAVWIIYFWN
jgi:NADH-quinone oxidoreductase subunit L